MKNILLIDDDITSLDIVSFLFEQKGYNVQRCADGFMALKYLEKDDCDCMVVDLMMPGINGVETVRRVRGTGLTVPIIAFTAVDDPVLHDQAINAGCNKVLTKPCRPEKLVEEIGKFLPSEH